MSQKNFVNTGIRFPTPCFLQIYVQTRNPANQNMYMVKDEYPDRPLTLEGALGKRKHYQQFQPVITLAKGYTIHWDQVAPAEVTIWLINFSKSVNTHTLTHTRAAPATAHTAHTPPAPTPKPYLHINSRHSLIGFVWQVQMLINIRFGQIHNFRQVGRL